MQLVLLIVEIPPMHPVIVQVNSTRVSSVIFYQCRQSGFAPSGSSAVCMESGRWSPDPSQVVCRMVTTTMPMPTY